MMRRLLLAAAAAVLLAPATAGAVTITKSPGADLNAANQAAAFNYMAVSANTTTESASNTTLPGEITTAGGGLLRAQATFEVLG